MTSGLMVAEAGCKELVRSATAVAANVTASFTVETE